MKTEYWVAVIETLVYIIAYIIQGFKVWEVVGCSRRVWKRVKKNLGE